MMAFFNFSVRQLVHCYVKSPVMIINASAGRQQVVNITVLALVPVVSAIIFEY